jgi:hypothetical protein
MNEKSRYDDDSSVFDTVKAATERIAKEFHAEEDTAHVVGTVIGAWASIIAAAARSLRVRC